MIQRTAQFEKSTPRFPGWFDSNQIAFQIAHLLLLLFLSFLSSLFSYDIVAVKFARDLGKQLGLTPDQMQPIELRLIQLEKIQKITQQLNDLCNPRRADAI